MKIFRQYNSANLCYLIEYDPHISFLAIHKYWDGTLGCGFVDHSWIKAQEVGYLELLLDTGISKRRMQKVVEALQQTKTSISATDVLQFLRGETDELKEYNDGVPWPSPSTISW